MAEEFGLDSEQGKRVISPSSRLRRALDGVGGQRHASAALPRERPGTHCVGGWVVPRAGLDGCGKSRPTGIRSPDRPARSESLYRLSYRGQRTVQEILSFSTLGRLAVGPNRPVMQGAPAALPLEGKSADTSLGLHGRTPALLRSPLWFDVS